jgi:hypothetical protein
MRLNAIAAALVLNLAMTAGLVWLWSDPQRVQWAEPAALPPALDEVAAADPSDPAEVSRFRETLERPLFSSTRKIAPRPSSGDAQAAADALKDVRLLGTYGGADRGGIVISRAGKVERLPVGASIGDWKLAGQEGRGAALVRANGERHKLDLALNTTAPAAPASPAAAGRPAGQPDAAPAASAEQARVADPGQATAGGRPAPAAAAPTQSAATPTDLRRLRLERLNARRALQGLPPLPDQ